MAILEHVKIAYDLSSHGEIIEKIFSNNTARTIWLAVRPGHMVDQNFDKKCLQLAKQIDEQLKSEEHFTGQDVYRILSGFAKGPCDGIIGPSERAFGFELLPFLKGEKTITYEVVQT